MRQSFSTIKAGLAILAVIAAAGPAAAQHEMVERTVRQDVVVPYHDLNLNDERDAATLLSRIDRAAEQACGGRPVTLYELNSSSVRQDYYRCHMDATTRAVESVGAPLLKRLLAQSD